MKETERFNSLQGLVYSGKLQEKQFTNSSKVVSYERLSPVQNELYKRLLIGLDYYSKEEVYAMNSTKKSKIVKRHKVAQEKLNLWKQQIVNNSANKILLSLFGSGSSAKAIKEMCDVKESKYYMNNMTFKELGLKKIDVINKLISEKLLPINYATL